MLNLVVCFFLLPLHQICGFEEVSIVNYKPLTTNYYARNYYQSKIW